MIIRDINEIELMDKELIRRRLIRLRGNKEFSVSDMARYLDMARENLWKVISGKGKVTNPLQVQLSIVFKAMDKGELVPVQSGRKNAHVLERRKPVVIAKPPMPRINFGPTGPRLEFD